MAIKRSQISNLVCLILGKVGCLQNLVVSWPHWLWILCTLSRTEDLLFDQQHKLYSPVPFALRVECFNGFCGDPVKETENMKLIVLIVLFSPSKGRKACATWVHFKMNTMLPRASLKHAVYKCSCAISDSNIFSSSMSVWPCILTPFSTWLCLLLGCANYWYVLIN